VPYRLIECADSAALAVAVAAEILSDLREAVAQYGRASLVVPGGKTPVAVFEHLATAELAWEKVTIIPCDERWVPADHPDSNEGLIRRHLLKDRAGAAALLSLYRPTSRPADAMADVAQTLDAVARPFSCVFLGMGDDSHFASLFPGRAETGPALDLGCKADLMALDQPAKGHPRLGLTLSALTDCRRILLAIQGPEKRIVLGRAIDNINEDTYPIAALLRQARTPVEIFSGA
jgi:6-phosphogluconolactonase